MSPSNTATAIKACRLLSERRIDAVFEQFAEGGTWTMPFREDRFAYAGKRNAAEMAALLREFLGGFDSFEFKVLKAAEDGNLVAIMGESHGVGPGEARYQNTYHLFFTFCDGKIAAVRELFDPYQVEVYGEQVAALTG